MMMTPGMRINQKIKSRVLNVAIYIVNNKSTVRDTAIKFNVSKSTVHKDVTDRLAIVNPELYKKVEGVLAYNKFVRHIRGGEATKIKFKSKKVI